MKSHMSELTKRLQKVIAPLNKVQERQVLKSVNSYMNEEYTRKAAAIHFRILGAELSIDKPPQQGPISQRLIRVLVADYGNRLILEFLLDPKAKILKVENYSGLQPAFHKDEIKEARTIAQRDNRIDSMIKATSRNTTNFVSAFAPAIVFDSSSNRSSRLVGLHYVSVRKSATANNFRLLVKVVVDLSERSIISFEIEEKAEDHDKKEDQQ